MSHEMSRDCYRFITVSSGNGSTPVLSHICHGKKGEKRMILSLSQPFNPRIYALTVRPYHLIFS